MCDASLGNSSALLTETRLLYDAAKGDLIVSLFEKSVVLMADARYAKMMPSNRTEYDA